MTKNQESKLEGQDAPQAQYTYDQLDGASR